MSWLDKFQNSRFGRPFRKRQKLGEDEDDWCDALSNFHMDSSSSDEFVDAHEQVPVNSSPKGRKRKKTKSKNKNKKQKDSEIFGDSSSSSSTADTFTVIEGTAEIHPANPQEEQPAIWSTVKGKKTQRKEKLQKRKSSKMQYPSPQPFTKPRQGCKERSKSTGHDGYTLNPGQKCSDSRFKFGSAPEIASSSSSNVDEQMDTQHAQGGLTDAKILEVAKAIGGNIGKVNQLGRCLGFTYSQLNAYHPQGISVGYSLTTSMLQDWKHKTSQQQQLPELLAALKKSGLCSLADKLDINKDHSATAAPKKTGHCLSGVECKASSSLPSSTVDKTKNSDTASTSYDKPIVHQQTDMERQMDTGEISERQIEQLARDLYHDVDYKKVRLLGKQLDYTPKEVFDFCGYEKRKGISGVLRMLRDWRDKTFPKSRQIPSLHEALQRADLKHLIANLQLQEVDDPMDSKGEGSTSTDTPGEQLVKVGISDDQLQLLAKDLLDGDYRNAHSLAQRLGFKKADINRYCGFSRPRDSFGILNMLRAWRDKTDGKKQKSGLLTALKKENLQHLTAHLQSEVVDEPMDFKEGSTSIDKPAKQLVQVGISDDQLQLLAKDILDVDYRNAHSLGQRLGFKKSKVESYCGKGRPRNISGILSMLRAWRDETKEENQKNDLLAALDDTNLKHLAGHLHQSEDQGAKRALIPQKRKVTVTLMTSSQMYTIDGLKKELETLKKLRPDLVGNVKVLQLPYSRIQHYRFSEDVDIMILCHSIENRRFAITNVTDSLYDEFLDYCHGKFGQDKIVVVAHDFPPEAKEVRAVKMDSFKHTQWTTFEKAGLVMICGMMHKKPEMEKEDWASLVGFLEAASKSTPIGGNTNPPLTGKKGGKADSNKSKTSNAGTSKFDSVKSLVQSSLPLKKQPIIYICTSSGFSSVKGLQEKLRTLVKRSYSEYEVKEKELPYSRLQDFRFPGEVDVHDAMILCHSVHNRGFSITNVPNSIYDEYLQYCNQVFGKYHLAVIVHDFEDTEEILRIHMDTFRRGQPKTFQLAGFVALARKLDVADVQLSINDLKQLEKFVKNLR